MPLASPPRTTRIRRSPTSWLALCLTCALLLGSRCSEPEATGKRDTGDGSSCCDEGSTLHDTGFAVLYWTGEFQVPEGEFSYAEFGLEMVGTRGRGLLCEAIGPMDEVGPAELACPECEWSFALSAIHDSVEVGDECLQLGITTIDGDFAYSWGFASEYIYDDGVDLRTIEDVVLLAVDGEWLPFAFNGVVSGPDRSDVTGSADALTFRRRAGDGYSYYPYYVY